MCATFRTLSVSEICKRDARGRVLSTALRRQRVLEEFERSGLSGPAFARAAGIKYLMPPRGTTWRHQGRKASAAMVAQAQSHQGSAPVRFLEAGWPPGCGISQRDAALRMVLLGCSAFMPTESARVPLAVQLLQALRGNKVMEHSPPLESTTMRTPADTASEILSGRSPPGTRPFPVRCGAAAPQKKSVVPEWHESSRTGRATAPAP